MNIFNCGMGEYTAYALLGAGTLVGFVGMEFMAEFTHRYLMHGPLWFLHADHHARETGHFFQRNDFFFMIFAVPSWLAIQFGYDYHFVRGVGFGLALFGLTYIVIHEFMIHRRFSGLPRPRGGYLGRLARAHHRHHARTTREGGVNFGLLWLR